MLIEPAQFYLLPIKILESFIFIVNMTLILEKRQEKRWDSLPLLYKLLFLGHLGWFIFISLDLIIYTIAALSFESTPIPSSIEVYAGYPIEYPSLLLANILRDFANIGASLMMFSYVFISIMVHKGEDYTMNILKNRLYMGFLIIFSVTLSFTEQVSVALYPSGEVVVDALWSGFGGISILIFLILYLIAGFSIKRSLYKQEFLSKNHQVTLKAFTNGILFMGYGLLFIMIFGVLKDIYPEIFLIPAIRLLILYINHLFWLISPLLILVGLKIPLEEIQPKAEDYYHYGLEQMKPELEETYFASLVIADNIVIYLSHQMKELIGEKVLYQTADKFLNNYMIDTKTFKYHYKKLMKKNNESVTGIDQIQGENKDVKWVQYLAKSFSYANENVIQYIFLEITQEKELEERIASQRIIYELIMNTSSDLIIQTDISSIITQCNPSTSQLLGYSHEELIHFKLSRYVKEVSTFRKYLNQIIQDLKSTSFEITLLKSNQQEIIIEFNVHPIIRKEIVQGLVFVGRNVSEERIIEERRSHTQKLESIALLSSGIAHDYNNMLTIMNTSLELLELEVDLKDNQKKYTSDLRLAISRATELTNQLLTFSKEQKPKQEPSSILDLIIEAANFSLHGSKSTWEYSAPVDLPFVNIDKNQILRVLNNIILNASHAMLEGGIIKFDISVLQVNSNEKMLDEGEYVHIQIIDQGHGIPEDIKSRIFEPYFSTKEEGTGLGLSIAYTITQKHGGLLTFDSNSKGTTFHLYLPTVEGIMEKPTKEVQQSKEFKFKVLVMDDEENIRSSLSRLLEHLGCTVDTAKNGTEAIEKYKGSFHDRKFDLLIMDYTIPGELGGKEAIQELYSFDPEVVAILSSGYSEEINENNYQEYHFKAFLRKPFSFDTLRQTLQNLINTTSEN
ncbi:MAG: response regulator [Candidatus Heimdallarchaeota archaeon]|nr:response regulator [Candidatus Heimdallarchaeota archaeon]